MAFRRLEALSGSSFVALTTKRFYLHSNEFHHSQATFDPARLTFIYIMVPNRNSIHSYAESFLFTSSVINPKSIVLTS